MVKVVWFCRVLNCCHTGVFRFNWDFDYMFYVSGISLVRMGFVDFLLGAVKILVAAAVAVSAGFASIMLLSYGKTVVGVLLGAIAFVGGIYVVYERAQQGKRV